MTHTLFRKKPILAPTATEGQTQTSALKRVLGPFDLILFGVGAIIGTGIFVLTGIVAAEKTGPALVLSFILAGLACAFAAMCYAELASMVPGSGSAYTYSYSAFGEIVAWVLGWDLMLEYGLACASVASGWSGYFQGLLAGFGIHLPQAISSAYNPVHHTLVDLPAVLIMLAVTTLLSRGIRASARVNAAMVLLKVGIVLLFIVVGAFYVKPANWSPFMPFGFSGVTAGAATIFYAYIGFDAVSTAAEEVKNPQKHLPIGILGSLVVATVLYMTVSLVLTGMVPYVRLDVKDPVAYAVQVVHLNWIAGLISLAAIIGITTVLIVMSYGQTRLLYSISRDGLLPSAFSAVDKRQTPVFSNWTTGIVVCAFAGFVPLDTLAELVNIGTLFAFITVSIGVLVLRRTHPNQPRPFRVPFAPVLPALSVLFCGYLLVHLSRVTWVCFVVWLAFGLVVYFAFGHRHSRLASGAPASVVDPDRIHA
ncbi:MAG: amino acid permease [Alicyclobacillus herbarius]|uniref:amino acid permease n=1 Tax=Alicyclobacillus herbarius TaxID=122960 RepID=UPI0023575369|nr:amino acid permease [Alicyclobacillus herbarius]MCL6633073.1 amino acid permease [Alicyclobacillus herbarius]